MRTTVRGSYMAAPAVRTDTISSRFVMPAFYALLVARVKHQGSG